MTVEVDGHRFKDCTFEKCTLIYRGGGGMIEGNTFTDCHWTLKGSAANTIGLLRDLYAGGWQKDVQGVVDAIRGIENPLTTKAYRGH